ncbi:LAMI_0G13014g1_1 [Lachancea mirantina]|uniref:LAMI_0G13014g1_1 n=1 Tax=Lachancea mirantina TaxID=1230905 RepID=A0A1G4KBJ3_9SACH|nr:LAMI_0G13014g1_1 [Lachancea mirantina]
MIFDETPRWILYTGMSSLLCVAGALCVPLVSRASTSAATVNTRLLNYGLSLSAGSMLATSLYRMLPHDEKHKKQVFMGFLLGVVVSFILNFIVHAYTNHSLVHCAHGTGIHESDGHRHGSDHSNGGSDHHDVTHSNDQQSHFPAEMQQRDPVEPAPPKKPFLKKMPSLIDLLNKSDPAHGTCYGSMSCLPQDAEIAPASCRSDQYKKAVPCIENDIGYDLENLSMYRNRFLSIDSHGHEISGSTSSTEDMHPLHDGDGVSHHHHHHVATPFSKLVSIGVQTCAVMALHKFPEGFIIFFTNNDSKYSKAIGFSIFLSLAIHNFIEGFSMTLPLYAAFKRKWVAVLVTIVLGGGSQPLGALLGYLSFHYSGAREVHVNFLLSLTAGFLFVIGLQMFQTAVGFSDGHHHHDTDESMKDHALGTVCLHWCCAGVLLILSTGLFA